MVVTPKPIVVATPTPKPLWQQTPPVVTVPTPSDAENLADDCLLRGFHEWKAGRYEPAILDFNKTIRLLIRFVGIQGGIDVGTSSQ
jgi:hypothetical protein